MAKNEHFNLEKNSTVTGKNNELSALLERSDVSLSQFWVYCTVFALSSWIEEIVFLFSKLVSLYPRMQCAKWSSACFEDF